MNSPEVIWNSYTFLFSFKTTWHYFSYHQTPPKMSEDLKSQAPLYKYTKTWPAKKYDSKRLPMHGEYYSCEADTSITQLSADAFEKKKRMNPLLTTCLAPLLNEQSPLLYRCASIHVYLRFHKRFARIFYSWTEFDPPDVIKSDLTCFSMAAVVCVSAWWINTQLKQRMTVRQLVLPLRLNTQETEGWRCLYTPPPLGCVPTHTSLTHTFCLSSLLQVYTGAKGKNT